MRTFDMRAHRTRAGSPTSTVRLVSDDAAWIEAGLYEPDAPSATQRRELLEWLAEQGIGIDEMVKAEADGQLASLAGDRSLRPGRTMTIEEIAEACGMTPQLVHDVRAASGLASNDDAIPFREDDLAMFHLFASSAGFFSKDELLHLVRVMGTSIRRIAEASSEMFMRDVEAPLWADSASAPLELAKANKAAIELARSSTGVFDPMFRVHLQAAVLMARRAREGTDDYSTVALAIGFVDLNGFTSRSAAMEPRELLDLVMRFEEISIDLISRHGARLVKLIGDEVMFAAVEPEDACAIALGLVEKADEWASGARAGVAHGPVITSGGDLYGEIVNLAARMTDIAVPGEVLVNEAVTERATARRFHPAGRRQLKGFPEPVRLWSLDR
jgi:adenylate cyclase